jgi:hypothetical protein
MNETMKEPMNEPVNFFRPIQQLLIENLALASDRTPRCRRPGKNELFSFVIV